MPKDWKPADYTSVAPYLVTQSAQAIIDFLRATVDACPCQKPHPHGSGSRSRVPMTSDPCPA